MVADNRFRLIDTAGSELGVVTVAEATVSDGDTVLTPGGRAAEVVEVYDDKIAREGGVQATLVVSRE